jgi:hypothetical protein
VRSLLNHLSRRDVSTIHAIWSWYGAGKTHTLRFISHLCRTEFKSLLPLYIEFPRGGKSFLDLYKRAFAAIDEDLLLLTYEDVAKTPSKSLVQRELTRDFPDLGRALNVLLMGSSQNQNIARLWLMAENVTMRDARSIGLTTRLDSAERAIQTLAWMIRVLSWAVESNGRPSARLVWMVDEYQRIEDFAGRAGREINGCLHSVFNRCPRCFTMILSFSGPPSHQLPPWMSKELADRMGIEKVMILPPLTSEEAGIFVRDLLQHFRAGANASSNSFPFDEKSIRAGVAIVQSKVKELRPRVIMQAFNAILEVAEPLIQSGKISCIDENLVAKILSDREFQNPEVPQE